MGLDARALAVFWEEFFRLALSDRRCLVYGIEAGGGLQGALVVALHGFPGAVRGAVYVGRLLLRLGPASVLRYLRFVRAYDRAMCTPGRPAEREARCYWLFVTPAAPVRGLGSRLLRSAFASLHRAGYPVATGFVDAGNGPLLHLYRRLGITIGPALDFLGARAVRVEIPTARLAERAS
jgi:ribosomal protein S18 acetylase RimI-like enzyme